IIIKTSRNYTENIQIFLYPEIIQKIFLYIFCIIGGVQFFCKKLDLLFIQKMYRNYTKCIQKVYRNYTEKFSVYFLDPLFFIGQYIQQYGKMVHYIIIKIISNGQGHQI